MHFPDDTIAALSTPPGQAGIAVIRISGPGAVAIADRIFRSSQRMSLAATPSHTVMHGLVIDPAHGSRVDEVLVTVMRAPRTYTREDVVEINCHGGPVPLRRTLELVMREGARLAGPGEFTKRAFLNGRIDLSQAEAVIDLIRAQSDQAERLALDQLSGRLSQVITQWRDSLAQACAILEAYIDFPDEEVAAPDREELLGIMATVGAGLRKLSTSFNEGRLYRDGAAMAIVGKPNVGKSSLLNALLQHERAIVTELPGTTRDVIEESLVIEGVPVRIMDTAGIREAHDLAEAEGVKRSLAAIEGADLILAVFDSSKPFDTADRDVVERLAGRATIIVLNKSDIAADDISHHTLPQGAGLFLRVSAKTGAGLDELKAGIIKQLLKEQGGAGAEEAATVMLTNLRHKQLIDRALGSLAQANEAYQAREPIEITALLLREALDSLGEIVGAVTTEDILDRIFSRFCIGK